MRACMLPMRASVEEQVVEAATALASSERCRCRLPDLWILVDCLPARVHNRRNVSPDLARSILCASCDLLSATVARRTSSQSCWCFPPPQCPCVTPPLRLAPLYLFPLTGSHVEYACLASSLRPAPPASALSLRRKPHIERHRSLHTSPSTRQFTCADDHTRVALLKAPAPRHTRVHFVSWPEHLCVCVLACRFGRAVWAKTRISAPHFAPSCGTSSPVEHPLHCSRALRLIKGTPLPPHCAARTRPRTGAAFLPSRGPFPDHRHC